MIVVTLRRRLAAMRADNDRGAVAVLVALLTIVFMGCAALAVDIGRAQVTGFQLQKAADAGALAGDVYMPDNYVEADKVARAVALQNVRVAGSTAPVVTTTIGARPTQLIVTISMPIRYFFGAAIGLGNATITRSSTADFAGPTPMGSPCNVFGREDMPAGGGAGQASTTSANCAGAGTYWVNIAGVNVNKARGDAYAAQWCTKPDQTAAIPYIDECTNPTSSAASPGTNTAFDPNGYVYIVRNTSPAQLTLQGYDIAWAATGDNCNQNLAGAAGVTNSFVTSAADSNNRYAASGNVYCPGDTQMVYPEGDLSIVRTIATVRGPSTTSFNPLDGPILCTRTWNGWGDIHTAASTNGTPNPPIAAGGDLKLADKLDGSKGTYDAALAEVFHRWAPLCAGGAINAGAGDYSIQIQTLGGGGQNRFGLRAVSSGSNDDVSIFAAGRTSLFNNVPAGTSNFFLVRLGSGTSNHVLTMRFFDIGDSAQPVKVQVLQPDSGKFGSVTTDPNQPWTGCSSNEGPSPVAADCSVTATAAKNGGVWQAIQIPIPANYACTADGNQAKCWVKVRLSTTAGQADTTTWSAKLDGDPVRIIK